MESAEALRHARAAARFADVCTVRDETSRQILTANASEFLSIQEYADPAFRLVNEPLPAAEMAQAGVGSDEPVVAVVARNWWSKDGTAVWEQLIAAVLRDFAVRHSIRLLFIPFHATADLGNDLNNDPAVIARMRDVIGRERTAELPHGLRPGQISAVLANCLVVVSMRLHGAILSVRNTTPFVAIDYDPKVSSVMSGRGLGHFVTPMPEDEAGAQNLERLLEDTWTQRTSIREFLQKAAHKAAVDAGGLVERLRTAVSEQKVSPDIDVEMGKFLAETAGEQTLRLAEAEAKARRASHEAQSLYTGIRLLVDSGEPEAALIMLRAWLPDRREAMAEREYLLGFCLQSLGRDPHAAMEHYANALRCGFDEFWVRYNRGALALQLGLQALATEDIARAHTLRPDHPGLEGLLSAIAPA